MVALVKSTKHLNKVQLILLKYMQKMEENGTLPNSFYEFSITLIPKPGKESQEEISDPYSLQILMQKSLTKY